MTTSISNTFSFSRLMMVMKRDLIENWKNNLQIALSIYGAFLLCAIMSYVSISDMVDSSLYFAYRLGFYTSTACITLIVFIISAGHIMDVLQSKEKRISYIMLPATQAEKFVSRALQATLGTLVMVTAALLLAEITRLLLFPLIGAPEALQKFCLFDLNDIFLKGAFLDGLDEVQDETLRHLAVFTVFSGLIYMHAIFILGGTYFYKRPVIKTFGLIILGATIFSFITGYLGTRSTLMELDQTILVIASSIIYLILATIFWILSYFLFTRSQVSERINFKFLKRS